MYLSTTVRIPDLKGKIFTMKKGQSAYIIYQYGSVYDPDKQRSVPRRSIIGKRCPDDHERMFPNEKFKTYFPDRASQEDLLPDGRSSCLKIGLHAVVSHIAEEYSLRYTLSRYLCAHNIALILDLASFLIAANGHTDGHLDGYAFDHPLFSRNVPLPEDDDFVVGGSFQEDVVDFLRSVGRGENTFFMFEWIKDSYNRGRICITQDLADKSLEPGHTYIADFDSAGSGMECPVHNVAVAMDAANRMPLFYAEYPGSACDVSQFSFMAEEAANFGFTNLLFIIDRGPFCREHIRWIDEKGFSFAIVCRGTAPFAEPVVKQIVDSFDPEASWIPSCGLFGTTVRARLFEDDAEERYFHVYFDYEKELEEIALIEDRINKDRSFFGRHTEERIQFGERFGQYFDREYSKGVFTGTRRRFRAIDRDMSLCGYFCIITSEQMTAEEALVLYRNRKANPLSEKLFCSDKSFRKGPLGQTWWNDSLLESTKPDIMHVMWGRPAGMPETLRFVEFMALIISSRMSWLLEMHQARAESGPEAGTESGTETEAKTGVESGTEPEQECLTFARALCELERIEVCRKEDGSYKLAHALTKAQEKVLSALGLDEGSIRQKASELD